MTNLTDVTSDQLQALKDFANSENKQLVAKLEEILDDVARTGQYIYPWHFMKPLYACKLDQVTSEFLSSSPPLNNNGTEDEEELNKLKDFRDKLLQMFDKFVCAPFTIQRVSELLTKPKSHYKSTVKFFRGLEKNILVVSTVEPVSSDQRPVLKRSLHDDSNPISKQNGYVETELKPQMKKIHLEEKSVIGTDGANNVNEGGTKENGTDGTNGTNGTTTVNGDKDHSSGTSTGQDQQQEQEEVADGEGLENMLVCTEFVCENNGVQESGKTEDANTEEGLQEIPVKKDESDLPVEVPVEVAEEETKPIDES